MALDNYTIGLDRIMDLMCKKETNLFEAIWWATELAWQAGLS